MNTYKITYTAAGESHYDLVTEISESRAIQAFKRDRKGQQIDLVELVRENANATKDQERKAVDRIRAIVATLGPDSYTATALDGCLEIAECNIENDFADSWKGRCQAEEKTSRQLREVIKGLQEKHHEYERDIDEQAAEIEDLRSQIAALRKQIIGESVLEGIVRVLQDCEVLDGESVSSAAADIVNFADDPTSTGFVEAVRLHRESVKQVERLEAMRHSVEAALDAIHNASAGAL